MRQYNPYYPQNPYYAYQAAPNPYYAQPQHPVQHPAYQRHPVYPHYGCPQVAAPNRNAAGEGLQHVMQSEWSAQFGPTLVFLLIAAGNILGQSAGVTAQDMIWIHMALVMITCVLLWNHVAHIVAINAKPPPEEETRSSSSRSSSSKSSSSSSSSSSRSRSSSSKDPSSSSSSRPSSSSSGLRPPSSSSSSSSSSSRPSGSSSSRDPSSSSSSRPSPSSSSAAKLASSSSGSGSSSSRSSSSRDKEPSKDEKDEDPDPWGKAHPSSKLTREQPRLWPFPIGLAVPALKANDGKERVWWEGGNPHQVGYIGGVDGSSGGGAAADDGDAVPGASSSSRDKSASSSSSTASMTPKPTREKLADVKAIMKGTRELSKDEDKRARQKDLVKLMSAKKPADDAGPSSSRSVDPSSSRSLEPSSSSVKPPTPEQLAEVKAIMKGQAELSTDKEKSASTAKKGVSFADEPLGPTGSGDPGKPSSSRPGSSSSAKPESSSRSSRDPSGGADPSIPGPRRLSGPDDGLSDEDE
ncbi:hypothetical protein QFC20_004354 [Naganishia adeliensis]|uniref:Uncharacterized protein n=1 Tax=Naganishia adeliensis TaxID=92952 RepID=A0ACC2W0H2_9TREE|nr:hypothetical protein QFC20_004354 [Naganishia adeliensis]